MASTASCSAASARSRGADQRALTTRGDQVAACRAETFPPSSASARPALARAGADGSDSARRSAGLAVEQAEPRRTARRRARRRDPAAARRSAAAASRSLAPRRSEPGCATSHRRLRRRSPSRWRLGLLVELVEEPVHHPALPGLVRQRLADDPAGQLDRERADLGAQRGQRLLAVGVDLRVRRSMMRRASACACSRISAMIWAPCSWPARAAGRPRAGPRPAAPGTARAAGWPRPGRPRPAAGRPRSRRSAPRASADPRHQDLATGPKTMHERDRADDQLGQSGTSGFCDAARPLGDASWRLTSSGSGQCYLKKNGTAMPISASASVSAKPIHM